MSETGYVVIAIIVILAVVGLSAVALVRGGGFKFSARHGKDGAEVSVEAEGRRAGEDGDSSSTAAGSGNIRDVRAFDKARVGGNSNVNVHIGHRSGAAPGSGERE